LAHADSATIMYAEAMRERTRPLSPDAPGETSAASRSLGSHDTSGTAPPEIRDRIASESELGTERRLKERRLACFPAEIVAWGGRERSVAVILDASVIGANFLTSQPLTLGQNVNLRLYFTADVSKARAVVGRVVRVQPTPKDREWPFQVGVQFESVARDIEEDIKRLADLQAELFRLR
jgi:hypothetical protein